MAAVQVALSQVVPAPVMAGLDWFYHSLDGDLLGLLYMVGVCAEHSRRRYNSYLYSYLSCLVFSCGGSTSVALITGRPISLLSTDQYIMSSFLIWFLMFYTPVGMIFRFRFARVLLALVLSVGWGRTISWGVSVAEQVYPESRFSWIALGTMSGAGGGLIEILDQKIWGEDKSWSVLGFKTASFVACWFSLLTNPCSPGSNPHLCNIMSENDAMIVTGLMLTFFSLSASLFDRPFDYWYPVEYLFGLLTGIFGEFEAISLPSQKRSSPTQDSDSEEEEDDDAQKTTLKVLDKNQSKKRKQK